MDYCICASSASRPLPDHELMNMRAQSSLACKELGLTGLLVFHRNRFIHYYEGERSAINKILASIKKDKRHRDVKPLSNGALEERQFPDWSMELRVLDKDPLFTSTVWSFFPGNVENDKSGVKREINDYFMSIT